MLYIKSTATPIMQGAYAIDIAAKPPGKTFEVYLALNADEPPQALMDALFALGFIKAEEKIYKHTDGKQILDLRLRKIGTDLFEGWTEKEKEANLIALKNALATFSIEVAPRVMTMHEAF